MVDPRLESTTAENENGKLTSWVDPHLESTTSEGGSLRKIEGRSAAKSQSGSGVVYSNVAIGVGPTSLMLRYVGIDEVKNHIGHIVVESLGNALLGAGQAVVVAGELEPFTEKLLGDGNWAGRGLRESQGKLLLHLHVEEAGQDGDLRVSHVGWQWYSEGLFLIFTMVGMERSLAE